MPVIGINSSPKVTRLTISQNTMKIFERFPQSQKETLLKTNARCCVCLSGVKCGKDGGVDNHMEMGKKLLAAGQLADALSHFHAAVGEFISICSSGHALKTTSHYTSDVCQMEIPTTTWLTTGGPQCSSRWESPNLHCQT